MSRNGFGRWACLLLAAGLIGCHREAGTKHLPTTDVPRPPTLQMRDNRDESADDSAALSGRWAVVSSEFDGQSATATYRGTVIVIERNQMYFTDGFAQSDPSPFSLDASTNPKSIDIGSDDDRSELTKAIYSLDQDSLKLCMSLDGDRPKQFKTHAGDNTNLLVLKRQ